MASFTLINNYFIGQATPPIIDGQHVNKLVNGTINFTLHHKQTQILKKKFCHLKHNKQPPTQHNPFTFKTLTTTAEIPFLWEDQGGHPFVLFVLFVGVAYEPSSSEWEWGMLHFFYIFVLCIGGL